MILQNHGLLTASDSVEATVFWYISLDRLCHTQLLALAAVGGDASRIIKVGDKEAAKYDVLSMIECLSFMLMRPARICRLVSRGVDGSVQSRSLTRSRRRLLKLTSPDHR